MKAVKHLVLRTLHVFLICVLMQQAAKAQLHAGFTASPESGCAPVFVKFTDLSTGGATSWKWDLGNGTISFLQNPSTTYFNPGKYTIKLVIKKAGLADSVVKVNYITINALPKPLFKASDTTGCYPLRVVFTDQSIAQEGNIVKWEWDLGDGSVSTLQHPTHVYSNPGNYNVILRVTNTAGCVITLSKAQYIKIKDGVKAGYSFTGSSQCTPPSIIHFTNSSNGTGTLSYQWLFGDGNSSTAQNPSNTYNSAGLYTIQLIVKNNAGCTDTLTKKDSIAVGVAHAAFKAPDSSCENTPLQFFNTSQPATGKLLWNFGNGNTSGVGNPVTVYTTPGTYQVTLVADFGSCKDSLAKSIKILPRPAANFSADKTATCSAPLTVQFTSLTAGATSYQWLFGDSTTSTLQNPVHTYANNGSYTVTLVVTNGSGCTDTLKRTNYINASPASIDIQSLPVSGCAPLLFTPVYTIKTVLPVTGYKWNFGDGSSSTAAFPSHTYALPGVYTITLTYTTEDGCSGTITYSGAVRAGQKPAAAFSASPLNTCASSPVGFTDHSTGVVTHWLWDFGDGITDTGRNPLHLYNDTGYFSIKLIVANNGCTDTIIKPNLIYIKPPIAKFAADVQCANPFRFAFTNYSVGASTWNWDFGDGTTSPLRDPVHVYSAAGIYTVKLMVTNGSCTHVAAYTARIIKEKPEFIASDTYICKGDSITMQSFGFNPSNIMAYRWMPYNGNDTSKSIRLAYPASGKYSVSLAITNLNGCTDTVYKANYITVNGPTANFNGVSNAACLKLGGAISFADSSATDGTHAIKKWHWDFGDGSSQAYTTTPFVHNYTAAGYYTVALKVTDTGGCADSISKFNQIYIANPLAVFMTNDTMSCQNKPISFINNSQGQTLRYEWGFGDATHSAQQDPVHNFNNVGTYDAWLKITDAYGCTDSIFKPAYIHIDEPKAVFSMSDSASTCPPLVVSFANQSKYYKLLSWDFGDGTGALVDNPVHYYNYPGTYYAKLIVTSPGGCTDTLMKRITIKGPTGTFQYDKTASCNPGTIGFTASTQNTQSLIWDFNDGATNNTVDTSVSHAYTSMGIFIPRMILEDAKGCKVPIAGKDTIRIYGVSSLFKTSTLLLCDQGIVHFTDGSQSNDLITNYQWTMGDGSSATDKDPFHNYTATGIYPVKLVVTTANGCTDSMTLDAGVKVVSSPKVSLRGDSSACVPATIRFFGDINAPDSSALAWQWNFNNTTNSALQNPLPVTYQQDGSYMATMTVSNSSGCVTVRSKKIDIHPIPVVNAGENTIVCEKKAATLEATGADTYSWSPATGLSCTNCASPVAAPDSNIVYQVRGASIFGCKAGDSVIISVKHPFKMQIGSGDTLCKGESFHLLAKNADVYEWTPATGLDNSHIRSPLAKPSQTTDYQVIGTDEKGCFYDTAVVKLTVYPFPVIDAGEDKTIGVGSSVQLNAKISKDATVIQWQPSVGLSCVNCANPVANPKKTTSYRLMAINEGGCINKDELTIFVVCNNGNIFLPNTFSPNGSGTNDVFYPRGTGLYNIKTLKIFNRWGEQVFNATDFKANDVSKGWNGVYKGKQAPNDVYVYFVEVICENNALLTYSGNIALIR
jgi:gliding motility-associated-like protein